ncbi:MAG: hypothetical protein ACXWJK_13710 [Burkholderiaceae bacterium]
MVVEAETKREWHVSDADFFKAIYEHLKHVATLTTGSILLLSTFLEKVFKEPQQSWLVGLSLGSLFVALVASLVSYAGFLLAFPRSISMSIDKPLKLISVAGLTIMWMSFVIGVGSIATFFLVNWYGRH